MNNEFKFIDSLLFADRDLTEGWGELKSLGKSGIYDHLNLFMGIHSRPTILQVLAAVKASDMSNLDKFCALEGVSCDLGYIGIKLGFLEKLKGEVKKAQHGSQHTYLEFKNEK